MEKFIESGASRETSLEIMAAIASMARDDADAARIWEDPREEELLAIWERVTKNGLLPATEFYWGAAGQNWFN